MAQAPFLRISGEDILPFIESGGMKWTENDIDSPNAGRTLDGVMHRGKVTSKVKLEIKFLPLDVNEARNIINAVSSEYVTVDTNIDPKKGSTTYKMYNSSRPATCWVVDPKTGKGTWNDLELHLIQV